jgi:hypothetical protein
MENIIYLVVSLTYTTLMAFWLLNQFKTIYNHQFEITDKILKIIGLEEE